MPHSRKNKKPIRKNVKNVYAQHIYPCTVLLYWFGNATSIKIGRCNLVLWTQIPLLVKWCGHASVFYLWINFQPSQENWANSDVIKNATILSIIHNIFNFRDTYFAACLVCVICVYLRVVVSNTCNVVFLFCLSSSGVPYVASFSELSLLDCPFGIFLTFIYNAGFIKESR